LSKKPGGLWAAESGNSMATFSSQGAFWCVVVYEAKAGVSNNIFVDHSEPAAEVLATCFIGISCQCRPTLALSQPRAAQYHLQTSNNNRQQQHHHHRSSATFSSSSNSYQQRSPTALTTASSSSSSVAAAVAAPSFQQQPAVTAFSNCQQHQAQQQHSATVKNSSNTE